MTNCMGFSPNMELTRQKVQLLRMKKVFHYLRYSLIYYKFCHPWLI